MPLVDNNPDDPVPGNTSVRLGKAFLMPDEEKGHYSLYRYIVTVINEGGRITRNQSEQPVGPLSVYRKANKGEKVDLKTSDPKTNEPMDLILVWRPGMEGGR